MTGRRGFLNRFLIACAALASGSPAVAQPLTVHTPDESWLNDLRGKHKQFFDVNTLAAGAPLNRVTNFLDAYRDAYGLSDDRVNVIFGAHGNGLAFVLDDRLWTAFELGARYAVIDPASNQPALRNVFRLGTLAPSIEALQRRGVRFLACRQTINRLAKDLAAAGRGAQSEIAKTIEGGLLPGVTPVPAMVVAANRAQEAGLSYLYVG